MKIACLGWGSLVWDPREIPIQGEWYEDGPYLPIEFARESADGRITLVITDLDNRVRSLWTYMSLDNLDEAMKALAKREGVPDRFIMSSIGYWDRGTGKSHGLSASTIGTWANSLDINTVIWTNLKFGFNNLRDTVPSCAAVIEHLRNLPPDRKKAAEQYIRNAPIQVDTEYRKKIQTEMGWLPEK